MPETLPSGVSVRPHLAQVTYLDVWGSRYAWTRRGTSHLCEGEASLQEGEVWAGLESTRKSCGEHVDLQIIFL